MVYSISVRKKDLFLGELEKFNNHTISGKEMATRTALCVQQLQVPIYNHPCGDLLDGGRRREYVNIAVPLYRASIAGDLEAAKCILQSHEYVVQYSITEKKETPLHVAAAGHSTKLVSYLVNMMTKVDLELQNEDGNTAFCVAAISGNVDMVEIMLNKDQALPNICGNKNMMPLHLAAFHGKQHVVTFLYDQLRLDRTIGDHWTDDLMDEVLLNCIQAEIFDVAQRIMEDNLKLPQEKHAFDVLQLLARKPEVTKPASKEGGATLLLRSLWKRIMDYPKQVIDEILRGPMIEKDEKETYPSQVLFIAAKMNNIKFLIELIREYPDLIWTRNDHGQTIFHISVSHRHHEIYNLLYEIGSMKDLITPITDHEGNNIIHLVGKNPEKSVYEDGIIPQLLSEYSWYQEVAHVLPPPSREVMNGAGKTPQELFTENHEKLESECMTSINEIINLSLVVATLVCTMGFSLVFSIPGGFNQNNGSPLFIHNNSFIAFVLVDACSFVSSTCSVIVFLSITLSRHKGNTELVIRRWQFGQICLFYSILFLFVAFILSLNVTYLKGTRGYIVYGIAYLVLNAYLGSCIPYFKSMLDEPFGKKERYTLYPTVKTES